MQANHIIVSTPIKSTFRTSQVCGIFDMTQEKISKKEWKVEMDLKDDWNIGIIVGPSGSGKTTIARKFFEEYKFFENHEWHETQSIVDCFEEKLKIKDIIYSLSSVGLGSPPDWLKPYKILSNGQQFRADLARIIAETKEPIIFDEFTSVVDRDVAKATSNATQKAIRKSNRKMIAVSCHYDIIEWLQPDWVFDVSLMQFERRSLRRRPEIKLEVHRVDRSIWKMFRQHHYLDTKISNAAQCYALMWNGKYVAFSSYIHFPHPTMKGCAKREHRTVVLPDYQGLGFGNILAEWIAELLLKEGKRYISTTSHPAMIAHRNKNKKWRTTAAGHQSGGMKTSVIKKTSSSRFTCSFEYIGKKED